MGLMLRVIFLKMLFAVRKQQVEVVVIINGLMDKKIGEIFFDNC